VLKQALDILFCCLGEEQRAKTGTGEGQGEGRTAEGSQ